MYAAVCTIVTEERLGPKKVCVCGGGGGGGGGGGAACLGVCNLPSDVCISQSVILDCRFRPLKGSSK